jgi:uncharacterized protein (TIGR00369 family)
VAGPESDWDEPLPPNLEQEGSVDLEAIRQLFEAGIPFNRLLGLQVELLERGRMVARVPFRQDLIGDPSRPAIHGGVLSSIADAIGGGAVFTLTDPGDRVATIDLRIDYLRPGRPEDLIGRAHVIRMGNRVGVTSMRLEHPGRSEPIAVAKGVYTIKRAASAGRG